MKALVVALLVMSGCEHDPRYEHHRDKVPPAATAPVPVDASPEKTVERHGVDIPPMHQEPKIVPLDKRTRRHHRH